MSWLGSYCSHVFVTASGNCDSFFMRSSSSFSFSSAGLNDPGLKVACLRIEWALAWVYWMYGPVSPSKLRASFGLNVISLFGLWFSMLNFRAQIVMFFAEVSFSSWVHPGCLFVTSCFA